MPLSLPEMPSNLRKPGFYGSFSSGAAPYSAPMKLLLIGPKISTGSATAGIAARISADPRIDFGDGSILAEQAMIARAQRPFVEIWGLPLNVSGTKATATITVTAVPPAGTYAFWLFGRFRRREITVASSGETTTTVAAKIVAAANQRWTYPGAPFSQAMPCVATSSAAVVTLELRSEGTMVNNRPFVHVRAGAEISPLGDYVTVAHQNNGGGVPDVATALATLGPNHFQTIVSAYDDLSLLDAISVWQDDQWNPVNMRYCQQVVMRTGTQGALAAAGDAMNRRTRIFFGQRASPAPTWLVASAAGAELQDRFNLGMPIEQAQIMARALAGIVLKGAEAPMDPSEVFTDAEVNLLYFDGVSPLKVEFDGQVTLGGRVITTYQRSFVTGLEDTSWLDISDIMIPAYMMYYIRNYVSGVHAGTSLVSDERNKREGQTRPKDYKATCVQAYSRLCDHGIGDNMDFYVQNLVAEIASDRKRINAQHPVQPAAPFLVMANDIRVNAA